MNYEDVEIPARTKERCECSRIGPFLLCAHTPKHDALVCNCSRSCVRPIDGIMVCIYCYKFARPADRILVINRNVS